MSKLASDSSPQEVILDIEMMIEEIHKRPVLWDRFLVEYNDRVMKNRLWDEVHAALFDDWSELGSAEKRIRSEEIKKKWRNIRDTYSKDLLTQKRARKGKMRKKKPYRYKNLLTFLKGQFPEKRRDSSSDSSDEEVRRKRPRRGGGESRGEESNPGLISDVNVLIREVKSRPLLWNRQSQLNERNERNLRDKLWDEICQIIFMDWAELGSSARALRSVEVKKKWRNLRDSFGRELGKQRQVDLGLIKPKKPYRYFEELSFLHGSLEKRYTGDWTDNQQQEIEAASSNYSLESEYEDNNETPAPVKEDILAKTYDEDVCFAEMLVPMLKRLNDDQKHYAQVKILNVLKRARQFDPLSNIEQRTTGGVIIVKNENLSS